MAAPSPPRHPGASRSTGNRGRIGLLVVLGVGLPWLVGCPTGDSGSMDRVAGQLPEGVALSVMVVDDPPLATAIERLSGEWKGLTNSDLRVSRTSSAELAAAETLDADAVIGPSCQVGEVAFRAEIVPVPKRLLDDKKQVWPGIFSLLRVREAVWGKQTVGVPFGSPVLLVYYRADLLEKLGREPPRTWAEYQELAALVSDRKNLGDAAPPNDAPWQGVIEPLGPGWAAIVLLARAAPYVSHRENYSTMFRIDSMEPLIDGPPFVRALEELVATASLGSPEQLTYDPAAVRAAFWEGRCAMALTWPTAAEAPVGDDDSATPERPPEPTDANGAEEPSGAEDSASVEGESANAPPLKEPPSNEARSPGAGTVGPLSVGLAELPGSAENYDVAEQTWEPRRDDEDPHVPLLGTAGRLGLVLRRCQWPEAAFQLLFWLSDEQAMQVSPASPATTLFRTAHCDSPKDWVEAPMPAAAAAGYAQMTREILCRPQWMFALRIPGRARYLAALDEAVHRAVRGEQSPEDSLRQAATTWRQITEELGSERQRAAYWESLGLE